LLGLIRYITYSFSSLVSLEVLHVTLIRSELKYASVVWNNLTLANSNKLENTRRKLANLRYNRFNQPNFFRNYEQILNYLRFKTLHSRRHNRDPLFLTDDFKNKIYSCFTVDTLVCVYPLSESEAFPPLRSIMSQDLSLQQGASRMQTTANLWVFSINITPPLKMHLPLLNPAELRHYRVTCIEFQSTSSSSLSVAFSVLACYRPLAVGRHF
jgi:hypothetical protein